MFELTKQGTVHVIGGDAPLNHEHVEQLTALGAECLRSRRPQIVCDLRKIPLIDSAGLEFLLNLRDDCWRAGGSVSLAGPGPLCRDILVVSGVAEHFALFDGLTEAVGSYSQ